MAHCKVVVTTLLFATSLSLTSATNTSDTCEIGSASGGTCSSAAFPKSPVAGSIFESIRLRGGATSTEDGKVPMVLFLGDSLAEFAGTSLSVFCPNCNLLNRGIGGTMTSDWTMEKLMEVAASLPEDFMPTHVWLSIGANDFQGRYFCESNMVPTLTAEVLEVASNLRSILPPETQILLTGYAQTTEETCDPARGPQGLLELNAIFSSVAASIGATFIDAMVAVGGGSGTQFVPAELNLHQDQAHLSNKGYCKLFTYHEMQNFFGCQGDLVDCETVPVMPVPGACEAFWGLEAEGEQ